MIQVVEEAIPPDRKSAPRRTVIVLMFTALGLLGAWFYILGRNIFAAILALRNCWRNSSQCLSTTESPKNAAPNSGSRKTSQHRKHLLWSYVSTSGANFLRVGLGAVSGLMVSRLLMPRGRGELAILLYFPTLMAAFFSLGTPQAITALLSKGAEQTEEILTTGFRLAVAHALLAVPLFVLCAPLTLTGDNRQLAIPVRYPARAAHSWSWCRTSMPWLMA